MSASGQLTVKSIGGGNGSGRGVFGKVRGGEEIIPKRRNTTQVRMTTRTFSFIIKTRVFSNVRLINNKYTRYFVG